LLIIVKSRVIQSDSAIGKLSLDHVGYGSTSRDNPAVHVVERYLTVRDEMLGFVKD
jgi:hypothetical protein